MDDLISRQAAIDALDGEIEITGRTNAEAVKGYVRLVRDRLERLPSAEPRKKGKWLLIDAGYYDYVKCSQCGETLVWGKNFCPNCGCQMNGGEESD